MSADTTSPSKANSDIVISCGRSVTIGNVAELYAKLREPLGSTSTITLNVADIDTIDAAGMQLLVAYQQDAVVHKVKVEWGTPSQALRGASKTLGLDKLFNW